LLQIVPVAVFCPLPKTFDYELPDGWVVRKGDFVEIPFGRRTLKGVCVADPEAKPAPKGFALKQIKRVFGKSYQLPESLLKLAKWMEVYYLLNPGEILSSLSCPSPLQKEKESEILETRTLERGPEFKETQVKALEKIRETPIEKPILLHGITGSGKTEVYLELIAETLARGQSCILLLPEITLTQEMMRKIRHRFDPILSFHSGMTIKERREAWLACRWGGPLLVVGARSCLLMPLTNLGLVIVDEEHDSSYKQDNTPRYQGRDLAVVRAHLEGFRVILGSATPSLESYYNATSGKYQLVQMLDRISTKPMPKVEVVDLKEERRELKRFGALHFSRTVISKTKLALMKKQQVIFFLNRRGFATAAVCPACAHKIECPSCSVGLTYYKKASLLACHHCDYRCAAPNQCPKCQNKPMMFKGMGTEKMHQLLEEMFDKSEVVRIDGSLDGEKNIREKLGLFMEGKGDILLGTQIISKGLDSENITLSVALNADLGMALPDFRSAERDFQMLTQLAGRTGRGEKEGQAIFQSNEVDHYAIRHAINHDYQSFYTEEMSYRQSLMYPPFSRLARFVFSFGKEADLIQRVQSAMPQIRNWAKKHQVILLGPAPAPLERIKTRYRWHLVVKSTTSGKMTSFLGDAKKHFAGLKGIEITLDRDPQNMM